MLRSQVLQEEAGGKLDLPEPSLNHRGTQSSGEGIILLSPQAGGSFARAADPVSASSSLETAASHSFICRVQPGAPQAAALLEPPQPWEGTRDGRRKPKSPLSLTRHNRLSAEQPGEGTAAPEPAGPARLLTGTESGHPPKESQGVARAGGHSLSALHNTRDPKVTQDGHSLMCTVTCWLGQPVLRDRCCRASPGSSRLRQPVSSPSQLLAAAGPRGRAAPTSGDSHSRDSCSLPGDWGIAAGFQEGPGRPQLQELCPGHGGRGRKGSAGSAQPWRVVPLQRQERLL